MQSKYVLSAVGIAAFSLSGLRAIAAPIILSNTGVTSPNNPDGTNTTIIPTSSPDPHYLVQPPGGSFAPAIVVTGQPAYFRPGNSQYINDTGNGTSDEPIGNYDYQTTFSLTGLDPTTATISGAAYADNQIQNILINGVSTGFSGGSFTSGSQLNFTIPSGFPGFHAGLNTLDFIVNNSTLSPSPTAFDVTNLTGTAAPEPASIGLLATAVAGLLGRRRRGYTPSTPS
jgi:hypothetical protein